MFKERHFKRLNKKAKKGLRGWPAGTIAFYGPNLDQATKVAVGIVPFEGAGAEDMRNWQTQDGDIRADLEVFREIAEFFEAREVRTVAMTDRIIGCPHQEGIDYEGEWCPACDFWRGRDRFTGKMIP